MLFTFSKIFGFLTLPSTLIWLLLVAGLVRMRWPSARNSGRRWAWAGVGLMALIGLTPLSTWIVVPLEERFPRLEIEPGSTDYAGIIVLGGGEDGRASVLRRQLHINEAGERITEAAVLAMRLPEARLIFTGGAAAVVSDAPPGAEMVGAYWRSLGIPAERIVIESESRNTYENARFTWANLEPKPGERFLLVTSAWHMPRSIGVFRRVGFEVTAFPVDYRTNFPHDALDTFQSIPDGMKRFDSGVREWIGLAAYWLLGRTSALLPEPN